MKNEEKIKELIQKVEALFEKKAYKEIINLLPETLLNKYNNSDLYAWRAWGHNRLNEIDLSFIFAQKAIEADSNNHFAYAQRGYAWGNNNDVDKAIEDFTKAIELKPDYAIAYNNRGSAWGKKEEHDKAIADYNKAIKLKPDYAWAYISRGSLWENKGEYEKAIEDFTKAIDLKPDYVDAYIFRGISLDKKGEHYKAIEDYSKVIELQHDYEDAYTYRGISWYNKGEYDKAIADNTKAIELKPDNADAYVNRGNSWGEKGENDKAIADYIKAIELKPDNAYANNNRGVSWYEKGEYDKAIEDYTKAIEIKPDNAYAFNNRGVVWGKKEENEKAIEDYGKAIEINPKYSLAFRNKGNSKEKLNDNTGAIADYEAALKLNPTDYWSKFYRDQLSAKMGIPVELDDAKADATLYQIVNAVDELENKEDKLELIKYYKLEIEPIIITIREFASKIDTVFGGSKKGNLLAHYSNLKTADLLINNPKTHIRYSNAVFMNDPEEGKILIDYLDVLEGESDEIKKAFYNIQKEEKTNFYLGSFLPVKDNHEDELLMWRTYGKDENKNEAAGCCLLIDSSFFDEADGKHIAMASDKEIKQDEIVHPLYKVIYYNKRTKKIEGKSNNAIAKEVEKLKKVLSELLKQKDNKDVKKDKAIDRILYHSLSELRYFFKSADYYFENELRVIQFATHADVVKIDKESAFLPRRMYIESSKEIKPHLKKIILGPKVQYPERWMYLEELMKREGLNMDMSYSNCQYQ